MAKETFTRDKPHLTHVSPPSGDLTSITVATTAGVLTQFDADFTVGDSAGFYWKFEAAQGVAVGRMSVKESSLIRICTVENVSLSGTSDLITPYGDRFGVPQVGSKIFLRGWLVDSDSGQSWDMGIVNTVVTGT